MHTLRSITELYYRKNISVIDKEFDHFELNNDLEESLREVETATFYHNALYLEE
jgi:hypothetical protein